MYVNGEMVISFGDTIEIINDGQPYYSEKIGNWASIVPDSKFIRGLLFHPYDDVYHYSRKSKKNPGCGGRKVGGYELAYREVRWHCGRNECPRGLTEFLALAVLQFMTKQWGEVEPEEAEHNNKNPQAAIGAYMFQDEIKVYIKAENGAVRVFLPEEW